MKKSEILMAKHDKHNAYYDLKKVEYEQMEKNVRSLNRLGRLLDLNNMLMELTALINDALLDELVKSESVASTSTVKEVVHIKETNSKYCAEYERNFVASEVVHYTWYENRCFCSKCKQIMNMRVIPVIPVIPSYLDWQPRKVGRNQ
ncbi:hypothetical protein [Lysinibacillus sp. LZ02]|uniref:hypothetical protein n=1 Tax=Lysinibacillus sp. LZ02 TaxID=3420668 RepID=UPI003D35B197